MFRRTQDPPLHPLRPFFVPRRDLSQPLPQRSHLRNRIANVGRKCSLDPLPDQVRHLGSVAIRANHDLQRPVAVHAAKVKIALGRHVGDVGGDALLLAQLPDGRRDVRLVDGRQHHGDTRIVQVRGLEALVEVLDLLLVDAVGDFVVQAFARAEKGHFCVGVEEVQDAACCYLGAFGVNVNSLFRSGGIEALGWAGLNVPRRRR